MCCLRKVVPCYFLVSQLNLLKMQTFYWHKNIPFGIKLTLYQHCIVFKQDIVSLKFLGAKYEPSLGIKNFTDIIIVVIYFANYPYISYFSFIYLSEIWILILLARLLEESKYQNSYLGVLDPSTPTLGIFRFSLLVQSTTRTTEFFVVGKMSGILVKWPKFR